MTKFSGYEKERLVNIIETLYLKACSLKNSCIFNPNAFFST